MTTNKLPLSPTPRTQLGRSRHRALTERDALHRFLEQASVAHLGIVLEAAPLVLPVAFAVDLTGPDAGGTLYLQASVAARWFTAAVGAQVCVTVTELDGLVLARSGFHHSMNYRSAVILGRARRVTDQAEAARALELVVDHLVPGRSATLRPNTRKEVAATGVLAVPMAEASMKARSGDPVDEAADVAAGAWAGVVELGRRRTVQTAADSHSEVPAHVRSLEGAGA